MIRVIPQHSLWRFCQIIVAAAAYFKSRLARIARNQPQTPAVAASVANVRSTFVGIHPQSAQLAVQRGALHSDEFGRTRNIAAEAIDLRHQIFTLENPARVPERQRHQMLTAGTVW